MQANGSNIALSDGKRFRTEMEPYDCGLLIESRDLQFGSGLAWPGLARDKNYDISGLQLTRYVRCLSCWTKDDLIWFHEGRAGRLRTITVHIERDRTNELTVWIWPPSDDGSFPEAGLHIHAYLSPADFDDLFQPLFSSAARSYLELSLSIPGFANAAEQALSAAHDEVSLAFPAIGRIQNSRIGSINCRTPAQAPPPIQN